MSIIRISTKILTITLVACIVFACNKPEHEFYSGEWSELAKVEKWASFEGSDYRNTLNVNFGKDVKVDILQGMLPIKVSYENREDSIIARYEGLYKNRENFIIDYPWEYISNEEPIFILHKISDRRNALFLEWKGFYSNARNLDIIWARNEEVEYPPGATLEGLYLRPFERKNGDKELNLKNSVERELLSYMILGRKIDVGMSKYEISGTIVNEPISSRMSSLLTYRFKATDMELRTIGVDYSRNGVSYIQSQPSVSGENERYRNLLKYLGAKNIPNDKANIENVKNYFGFEHRDVSYEMLISKNKRSVFRIVPEGRIE